MTLVILDNSAVAMTGAQPTLLQSAYMRPHSVSADLPNLYFCGAGPHPGAGIPGVLASGKIVADLIGPSASPRRAAEAALAARH